MTNNEQETKETLKVWIEDFKNKPIMYNYKLSFDEKEVDEVLTPLLNLIEKQQKKIKSLEDENNFLKFMYKGTTDYKAIESFIEEK